MKKHRCEWLNEAKSGKVGGEEMGQLTGKDAGNEVEMRKTFYGKYYKNTKVQG